MAQTAAQKAAAAEAKVNAPKTQVIDRKLHFRPELDEKGKQPADLVIPLAMKTKTYRAMTESTTGGLEQLYDFVFTPLGVAAQVDELDIFDTTALVNSWFKEFAKLQEAQSLGE